MTLSLFIIIIIISQFPYPTPMQEIQLRTPNITCWLLIMVLGVVGVEADPQTNLLNEGCSSYTATDKVVFFANLNATFGQLQADLNTSSGDAVWFATAQQSRTSDPVYAMVQCRNYLSKADCLACFAVAEKQIRNCSVSNGARVIYDGCFLRYESTSFYDQTTLPGNSNKCGNKTATQASAFASTVNELVANLVTATPKIKGFFAATKKEVGGGSNGAVYGVAQCAETVSQSGCLQCLQVAQSNIQGCPPSTDGRAFDAGCFLRYSDAAFFADNHTTNIAPFLEGRGGSDSKKAIFGGVGGGVGLLLLIGIILVWYRHSRKPRKSHKGDILGATELQGPLAFKYKDLKLATKSFSEENKLGEGGFGDVYKGTLQNGKIVAVKKLLIGQSSRAKADFTTEVKLIGNVHHRNLVRLLGCCSKGPELLLVYEYMANSSLDKLLYGKYNFIFFFYHSHAHNMPIHQNISLYLWEVPVLLDNQISFELEKEEVIASSIGLCPHTIQLSCILKHVLTGERQGTLNWKQRCDIILGMAKGLAYLHEEFHVCIIHRDIKSSNILLDDDFQPKIADFGLARLLPEDKTHVNTRFAGTLGYTAPEYAIHGQLSVKVDTYSFGVVVLEIVSGCKSTEMRVEADTQYLLERARKLYESNMHIELVDERIDPNEYEAGEVKKIIEIGLMCTQEAALRPTMSEVIVMLLSKAMPQLEMPTGPLHNLFDTERRPKEASSSTASASSNATVSITQLTGR
ncbi:Serine-threonine/tyrosine-protein kinase, catalytic domain [Dillenia turbinata]|uniref:Serine-threonine/tyrosine-protein kinase, catalytic domain n=1 Tax=Dillenia turbinata TaxID=194707 RepID=A0AAN8ZA13_9MAGN